MLSVKGRIDYNFVAVVSFVAFLRGEMVGENETNEKNGVENAKGKRKNEKEKESRAERKRAREVEPFNSRRETGKILTYPNDIRKSRGVGGEERQQEPPRSHFRFRSAPPPLPPSPPTPPPPPVPPTGACASLLAERLTPLENKMGW